MNDDVALTLEFKGPFLWTAAAGATLFDQPDALSGGVYLWTIEFCEGYLPYLAGHTMKSFHARFQEHTRLYFSGVYTVFDSGALRRGTKAKIWPGLWYLKDKRDERQAEFRARYTELLPHISELLSLWRVFLAPLPTNRRVLERIEAAIMNSLYAGPPIVRDFPDRGMRLLPRRKAEEEVRIRVSAPALIYGLSDTFRA